MLRIVAVLLLIPLVDVLLLVAVASRIGTVPTVLVVVLTGLVGLLLVRAEGRHALGKIQRKFARGEIPTDELLDGGLLLIAGALMLTPGLVTDGVGFLFVLPPTRYLVRIAVKRWVVTPYVDAKTRGFATGRVYTGGFPDEGQGAGAGPGPDSGAGPGSWSGGDTYDVDDDAYDVDPEDGDEGR